MKFSLHLVPILMILIAPVAQAIIVPFIDQDEVEIILTDFRGPDGDHNNPSDWILENLNEVIADFDNITLTEYSPSLSTSDPAGDATILLAMEDATMIIWGYYDYEDADIIKIFPNYVTPFQVISSGGFRSESMMWGSGEIRPGMYNSSITDLLQLDYNPTEDIDVAGGVWLSMAQTYVGIAMSTVGRFSEGSELLEKALASRDPGWQGSQGYHMALFNAGLSQMAQDNTIRSIEIFSELIELDPQFATGFHNRGCAYYHQGNYDQAIDDFSSSLEMESENPNVFFMRGMAYSRNGMQNQGIQDFDRYLELDPDDALTLGNRGYAYYELGMYDDAIRDISLAVELEEQPATTHNITNLGLAYKDDGQYEKAIECLDVALEMAVNDVTAEIILYNRGDCYCWLNEFERGIEDFTASLELNPERLSSLIIRGQTYLYTDQIEAALSDFDRTVQLDPDWLQGYYWRGRVRAEMGDIDGAKEDFNLVVERTDSDEIRSMALEALEDIQSY